MESKISIKENYILVKPPKGINYNEIIFALSRLLSMPEFLRKNDIWVFREGKMDIAYSDLYKIKEFVEKNFPKGSKKRKTAIVIETGMQKSLAELYAKMEENLPHEIKTFLDFNAAEEWINKPNRQ
jgi:hypothetical protein